jgi:hypothetical protein
MVSFGLNLTSFAQCAFSKRSVVADESIPGQAWFLGVAADFSVIDLGLVRISRARVAIPLRRCGSLVKGSHRTRRLRFAYHFAVVWLILVLAWIALLAGSSRCEIVRCNVLSEAAFSLREAEGLHCLRIVCFLERVGAACFARELGGGIGLEFSASAAGGLIFAVQFAVVGFGLIGAGFAGEAGPAFGAGIGSDVLPCNARRLIDAHGLGCITFVHILVGV